MDLGMKCILLVVLVVVLAATCSEEGISIDQGTYNATVDTSRVEEDTRAFQQTAEIGFTFEPGQRFIYRVRAMGREIDDVGKWEIRGDSLHIFDLERGPNSSFLIEKLDEDRYKISGPNVFILTKVEASSSSEK